MNIIRNNRSVLANTSEFQKRYEPNFAWGNAVAAMQMLPGLRGLWPMSAFDNSGNAFDLSGNGRTLTYNGNPTYNRVSLAPYVDFDGTGDYLSRADEAGLDIVGNEAYVATALQGLTIGGWFWFDAYTSKRPIMTKWVFTGSNNLSYSLQWTLARTCFTFSVSTDGTAIVYVDSTYVEVVNQWYFIAGRFDPSTEVAIFCNGQKDTNTTGVPATIFSGAADLCIGSDDNKAALMDGKASLCFLCATALPDATIRAIYQHTRALYGVVVDTGRQFPSASPSISESASQSPSASKSPSASVSPSVSPSKSPSSSVSPSPSPSMGGISASASRSPSVSPSKSPSSSPSPSVSRSASRSVSPSLSPSASVSPSVSRSVSPSASISPSPSTSAGMDVEQTGSATTITSNSQNSSQAVTVPADADICVVAVTLFRNAIDWIPDNPISLGGSDLTTEQKTDEQNTNFQTWIGYIVNPATGSQTLAWDWGTAPSSGAIINVSFYKNVNTVSPITDSSQQLVSGTDLIGLSAGASDMMVGCVGGFDSISSVDDNGQTELAISTYNGMWGGFAKKLAGTGFYFTGSSWTTCVALVLAVG